MPDSLMGIITADSGAVFCPVMCGLLQPPDLQVCKEGFVVLIVSMRLALVTHMRANLSE